MDHEAFFLGVGLELSIYRWGRRIWAERVKQSFSKEKKIGYRKSQGATNWMRWKDVFSPATVKCSLHPPTLKCPGALWSPMLWGTTIGVGGSGWNETTCPDIPMKVSCPAVNLLISLFSAWLTVHVGVLYIEWNPAGSHCNSFSGFSNILLLTLWDPTWCTRCVLQSIGPAWGWQLDGACPMKTLKAFKWLSFSPD